MLSRAVCCGDICPGCPHGDKNRAELIADMEEDDQD